MTQITAPTSAASEVELVRVFAHDYDQSLWWVQTLTGEKMPGEYRITGSWAGLLLMVHNATGEETLHSIDALRPISPEAGAGARKRGDELQIGDLFRTNGIDRPITHLRPYPEPDRFDFMNERWQIMHSGDYAMTLNPDSIWVLLPNGAWCPALHHERELARVTAAGW